MACKVITQFRAKPGHADDLLGLLKKYVPESAHHAGCLEICIQQKDPYARWCGRGRRVTAAPMPISRPIRKLKHGALLQLRGCPGGSPVNPTTGC
jgi:hypothetical protein